MKSTALSHSPGGVHRMTRQIRLSRNSPENSLARFAAPWQTRDSERSFGAGLLPDRGGNGERIRSAKLAPSRAQKKIPMPLVCRIVAGEFNA